MGTPRRQVTRARMTGGRTRRARAAAFLFPAAIGLVAAGCGNDTTSRRTISAAPVEGGTGFEPTSISVHNGDRVDLRVRNDTTVVHGFDIDGFGLKSWEISPGQTQRIQFTARRAGTFRIFCHLHETHHTATLRVL
jgi:heme/copper-type cytochrome/quinol oxidase subunit 2